MAEVTTASKVIKELAPNLPGAQTRLVAVEGTTAANGDTLTVNSLTTVRGAFLIATDGTVGTMTFATNVITITNGGTKTWTGLAWGT